MKKNVLYTVTLGGGPILGSPTCLGIFTSLKEARKRMRDECDSLMCCRDKEDGELVIERDWIYYRNEDIEDCFEMSVEKHAIDNEFVRIIQQKTSHIEGSSMKMSDFLDEFGMDGYITPKPYQHLGQYVYFERNYPTYGFFDTPSELILICYADWDTYSCVDGTVQQVYDDYRLDWKIDEVLRNDNGEAINLSEWENSVDHYQKLYGWLQGCTYCYEPIKNTAGVLAGSVQLVNDIHEELPHEDIKWINSPEMEDYFRWGSLQ